MRTNRGKSIRTAILLASAGLALPLWAAPAMAQGASDDDDNDIIVTAQRRSERLEEVPMVVAVVSQETLTNAGINSLRDLTNVTTGFQIANSGIVTQSSIRGITSASAGAYESNVALYIDGLYQTSYSALNMDLPNVENIQVLKGPQGTLYGRNATGGAVLVETTNPGDTWQGQVEATYGRFDDKRGRAYIAGPLSDKVGISIAGTIRRTDGYYKLASRTTPGEFSGRGLGMEQDSIRAKLKFDLSETFSATLGYSFLRASDPRGTFFTPIENVNNNYTVPGRTTRARGLGEASGDVFIANFKQHEASLKLELDTGIGTLRSITGYADGRSQATYDSSGTYVPDLYIDSLSRDRTFQQSIDFNINTIKNVDLILGANYYNLKFDFLPGRANVVYLGPASISPFAYPDPATTLVPLSDYRRSQAQDFRRTKNAWAIFADATFHATDKLSITVGGRFSKETQDVAADLTTFFTSGATVGAVATNPYTFASTARRSSYSKFTARATARYEIAPRTNIYASFSQGFRGGEWNATVPNANPAVWLDAKQETIDAYEVGLKSAGSRMHFDISAFYYNYRNLQITSVEFVNGVAVTQLQNAPSAKIYGAEFNFDYNLTDNFTVRAGATWLHARYGDRFIYSGTGVNPNAVGFNTNSDPLKTFVNVGGVFQDLSGLQMARAPDFSGFIGLEYNIPNGEGGLRFAANVKYTSSYVVTDPAVWGGETAASYNARKLLDPNALPNNAAILTGTSYTNVANVQRARQTSFAMLNASVTWTDPSGHYFVRAWGNNLGNVTYRIHYRPGATTYVPIGEPLSFGGTIGYKF